MGSAARHSTGRKATSRQSPEGNRPPTRRKPQSALLQTTKPELFVPQTSLLDVNDALQLIGAAVDVTAAALEAHSDNIGPEAAAVLTETVSRGIDAQRDRIGMVVQALVKKRRRRKVRPHRRFKKP